MDIERLKEIALDAILNSISVCACGDKEEAIQHYNYIVGICDMVQLVAKELR